MILLEGGNIFKDAEGRPLTQRIDRENVVPTVQWLEKLTGLNLVDNMLGSTGKKPTSGDLDLGVDENMVSKQILINQLIKKGVRADDIRKSGDSVHLKVPILGEPSEGYVQVDFMFTDDPKWQKFSMSSAADSEYKGMHRALLLASIAKAQGMKWSYKAGLVDRKTGQTISKDPSIIALKLINGSAKDLASVESIIEKIKEKPNYEDLVVDARSAFERDKLILPESKPLPGTGAWYRSWKNRNI